jgi:excisionase family DNA binding protein
MATATPGGKLFTYAEAAKETGFSRDYIAHMVSKELIRSIKIPGVRSRFLDRETVEWLQQRKNGELVPPPTERDAPGNLDTADDADIHTTIVDAVFSEAEEAAADEGEPLALAPEMSLAVVMLVLGLLLALLMHKQPKQTELERFKQDPALKPLRQAVVDLASEVPMTAA